MRRRGSLRGAGICVWPVACFLFILRLVCLSVSPVAPPVLPYGTEKNKRLPTKNSSATARAYKRADSTCARLDGPLYPFLRPPIVSLFPFSYILPALSLPPLLCSKNSTPTQFRRLWTQWLEEASGRSKERWIPVRSSPYAPEHIHPDGRREGHASTQTHTPFHAHTQSHPDGLGWLGAVELLIGPPG